MKGPKTIFCCQNCGCQSPKWLGRCPECEKWGTLVEESAQPAASTKTFRAGKITAPVELDSVELADEERLKITIEELDRVLGGGIVSGSLVLVGGDPGIGKSTLLLQAARKLAANGEKVLYVSGEESLKQIKMRSERLGSAAVTNLLVAAETDVEAVVAMTQEVKPAVLIIDSIQTMAAGEFSSAPGSVGQVREATMRLMTLAKKTGTPTFLIGHVTKDGSIAGPKILEHMVDTVLYFEGDKNQVFRILRAVKNRFGPTNEIGVFEMKTAGLDEVANPSSVFLSEKPEESAGSVVTASLEGTRPILVELQALTSRSNLGTPRRTILGLDPHRLALLVAVMEKKLGMALMSHDIFMNVAGGVKINEPAVDLGILAAVASSFLDRPLPTGTVVLGEVGLTGEVRAVNHIETRVAEVKKMGFTRCLLPQGNARRMAKDKSITLTGVKSVAQAIEELFQG